VTSRRNDLAPKSTRFRVARARAPEHDTAVVGGVGDLITAKATLSSMRADVATHCWISGMGIVGVLRRVSEFEPPISYFVTDREMLTFDFRKLTSPAGSSLNQAPGWYRT
jgi:hypothetical protein